MNIDALQHEISDISNSHIGFAFASSVDSFVQDVNRRSFLQNTALLLDSSYFVLLFFPVAISLIWRSLLVLTVEVHTIQVLKEKGRDAGDSKQWQGLPAVGQDGDISVARSSSL